MYMHSAHMYVGNVGIYLRAVHWSHERSYAFLSRHYIMISQPEQNFVHHSIYILEWPSIIKLNDRPIPLGVLVMVGQKSRNFVLTDFCFLKGFLRVFKLGPPFFARMGKIHMPRCWPFRIFGKMCPREGNDKKPRKSPKIYIFKVHV